MAASTTAFRSGTTALVRAVAHPAVADPATPDLDGCSSASTADRMRWLREIWTIGDNAEALEHAAPALAAQVEALCAAEEPPARDVRRAALSVARYLLRAQHRPTPFGLFAGIATATVGLRAGTEWGTRHTVTARAGAEWLAIVVQRLETCPALLGRLTVLVNNTISIRGDRLIVPFQADSREEGPRAVEASVALTNPVRTALAASRTPIQVDALVGKLTAEFPGTAPERVRQLIEGLIRRRVLLTALQAPSTETDPLAYLLDQLDAADAGTVGSVADTVSELHSIHADLTTCKVPEARKQVAQRMRTLVPGLRRHPLALDLRLDARLALPEAVAREAERAAWALTRVCGHPYGTAAWGAYHQKFYERYGIGTMVPLGEVIADSGTGFPDGYPGAPAGPRRPQLSARDDALVRIAQSAVLDGRDEVVLTDELLEDLDVGPESPRVPPHLEIGVRVHAASAEDLERGRFRLEVISVSRGAGVTSGRFLSVLALDDRAALEAGLSDLPAADANTVPVQLSFPPLLPESAHVTRTPQVLPTLLSVEEHRATADHVLTPEDLAVACDGRRMYLAAPARGHRVEPVGMHALNLQDHTPPLVRFLTELSRAQCAQVTVFDWGAAAAMPYLPRLRYRRAVLAPARWRLVAADLPGLIDPRRTGTPHWRTGGHGGAHRSASSSLRTIADSSLTSIRQATGRCCVSTSTARTRPSFTKRQPRRRTAGATAAPTRSYCHSRRPGPRGGRRCRHPPWLVTSPRRRFRRPPPPQCCSPRFTAICVDRTLSWRSTCRTFSNASAHRRGGTSAFAIPISTSVCASPFPTLARSLRPPGRSPPGPKNCARPGSCRTCGSPPPTARWVDGAPAPHGRAPKTSSEQTRAPYSPSSASRGAHPSVRWWLRTPSQSPPRSSAASRPVLVG